MDQDRLKQTAGDLNVLLITYSKTDEDAAKLRYALQKIVEAAILGQIRQPLAWQDVPGDRLFDETNLRQYYDLEAAYAHFKVEATGGETPALQAINARVAARKAAEQK